MVAKNWRNSLSHLALILAAIVAKKSLQKVLGLMSGTSADGADVALIATDGENAIEFFGGLTLPYDRELRARVLDASQHDVPIVELARVERDITLHHAEAVAELLRTLPKESQGVSLIGFHGHTVRHLANEQITMQIGNPWLLAEKTGMRVVSDFRRHDMAVGGQARRSWPCFTERYFRTSRDRR